MGYIPPGLALMDRNLPGAKEVNQARIKASAEALRQSARGMIVLGVFLVILFLAWFASLWYIIEVKG